MTDTEVNQTPQGTDRASHRARIFAVVTLVVAVVVVLAVAAFITANVVASDDTWDVQAGVPVTVTIEAGSSASSIYTQLESAGVARASALRDAAKALGVEDRLKAGGYDFTTDMHADDVVRQLVTGPNTESGTDFTVVEGWTVERILSELADQTAFTEDDYRTVLNDGLITSAYLPPPSEGVDALSRWEGLLYPATYPIGESSTPTSILGAMADEMTRRLDAIDWPRLDALGVTKYEALIIASLIEREAGTDEERPLIASVIYNRLDAHMRLQIDATVIYALGTNPGVVTGADLEIDSPYNTYRIDGLPPTPIGTASVASLQAAGDPASTSYLFYVLGAADGSHLFADTYEGHQANIELAREAGVRP